MIFDFDSPLHPFTFNQMDRGKVITEIAVDL